jgi:hypothetical protein
MHGMCGGVSYASLVSGNKKIVKMLLYRDVDMEFLSVPLIAVASYASGP